MTHEEALILQHLRKTYAGFVEIGSPPWLDACHWRPTFLLGCADRLLAADYIPSGEIPRFQYKAIVVGLMKQHPELHVIVVTLEESYNANSEIVRLLQANGIGLKILAQKVGVQTMLTTPLDQTRVVAEVPREEGWFPSPILQRVQGLDRLSYAGILDAFAEEVQTVGDDPTGAADLVMRAVADLLESHPAFEANLKQLVKLAHFEELLRLAVPQSSEHVLHSFRVFLAGCPIVNEFYDEFRQAHARYCIGDQNKMSIDYSWFLTALFHDIGRPKEAASSMIRSELDDEELEISVIGKPSRWERSWYQLARRTLGSLAAFVANSPSDAFWDGGSCGDEEGDRTSTEWITIYDQMKSHAVISAFDFLGDIFKKLYAADARAYRPFVLTHGVPSALAILLHDYRIWEQAERWGLCPVDISKLPMAALLIYIDTWDDYRRKGGSPTIRVSEYTVDRQGARVKVEWANSMMLENEKKKYSAFNKIITGNLFKLQIDARMIAT